jgi:hypothetical protein
MSELANFAFKEIVKKEIECSGHKVMMKALTTRDSINMNVVDLDENSSAKQILNNSIELLSYSILSIDGITPDNSGEIKTMLENQPPEVIMELLSKYQEFVSASAKEIKN